MNQREQRDLATRIAKESEWVTIKFGRTNNKRCLHLKIDRPEARVERNVDGVFETQIVPRLAASETLFFASEWEMHPWNKTTRNKRDREFDRDLAEAIRNKR